MNLRWILRLDPEDQQRLYADLAAAVESARHGADPATIEACLQEWRTTAAAVDNGALRDSLLE